MKRREKAAADLLLLPGWAIPLNYYSSLLDAIKTKVRTGIFDYGFFPKTPVKEPMKIPALASDCAPLVIVAHSMGTLFAFRQAVSHPSVKAVILFGAFARFAAGGKIPGRSIEDIDAMRRHLKESPEMLLKSFYRASASPDPLRIPPPPELNTQALVEGLEILATADVSESLPSFSVPCLNFVSSNDLIVDAPMSSALSSLLPKMRTVHYTGAGHLLPVTKPREVAKDIDEFLASTFPDGIG